LPDFRQIPNRATTYANDMPEQTEGKKRLSANNYMANIQHNTNYLQEKIVF